MTIASDFRLTQEDFDRYVPKSQHDGQHLWDVLLPRLEEVFGVEFNVQGFNRTDYLEKLWLWPRRMKERWYQTRLVFHRPNPDGCFVGLGLERATDDELKAKGVVDPDWPRFVQYLRQNEAFVQHLSTLFEEGLQAQIELWTEEDRPPEVVRSVDELKSALADVPSNKGFNFYFVWWLSRDEVLTAHDQIDFLMHYYRQVAPVLRQLVPVWLLDGKPPPDTVVEDAMNIVAAEVEDLLSNKPQIVLQGAPGTGKTYLALTLAARRLQIEGASHQDLRQALRPHQLSILLRDETSLSGDPAAIAAKVREGEHGLWEIVQLHPSYSYEDFVRGLVAEPTADGHNVTFRAVNRVFGQMAAAASELAEDDLPLPVVLIIDEINRGDLSKILGELIYALEYRDETVLTPYAVNGQPGLTVPADNFYIIGTMNTADRSIALVDYAIRRRFAFVQLNPSREVIRGYYDGQPLGAKALVLFDKVQQLFDSQLSPIYNRDDMAVGHTYFLKPSIKQLAGSVAFGVAPLLSEYVREGVLDGDPVIDLDGQRVNLTHIDQFDLVAMLERWISADG